VDSFEQVALPAEHDGRRWRLDWATLARPIREELVRGYVQPTEVFVFVVRDQHG
jgi:hypothetical protein